MSSGISRSKATLISEGKIVYLSSQAYYTYKSDDEEKDISLENRTFFYFTKLYMFIKGGYSIVIFITTSLLIAQARSNPTYMCVCIQFMCINWAVDKKFNVHMLWFCFLENNLFCVKEVNKKRTFWNYIPLKIRNSDYSSCRNPIQPLGRGSAVHEELPVKPSEMDAIFTTLIVVASLLDKFVKTYQMFVIFAVYQPLLYKTVKTLRSTELKHYV